MKFMGVYGSTQNVYEYVKIYFKTWINNIKLGKLCEIKIPIHNLV